MSDHVLLVTITPTPQARIISWPATQVTVGDETFEDTGAGDTNGFYDYLRTAEGRIIGVRFMPFVEHAHLCEAAIPGAGLRITGAPPATSLELYWGVEREFEDTRSADQYFDLNYVLRSPVQTYAVTFGLAHLDEDERAALLSSQRWGT
jgi:hypothetical protein